MAYVTVLIADRKSGLSDGDIATALGQLDGAGAPRRLSPCAAEIPVPTHQVPRIPRIDTACVPADNRCKKLLIADMDSTIIPVECIDEVGDFAGVREQVVAITEPAMRGEISFEEALCARVALMAGLPKARLEDVYRERVSLNPGARVLVRTMAAHGAHTALVSGGFTYFTERVAASAGFHENRANELLFEDGKLNGKVAEPILGRIAKLDALHEITARVGIDVEAALAVGDGANDLAMITAAGLGVAYYAKPVVAEAADAAVNHGDLTALLYLQGYAEHEFVDD